MAGVRAILAMLLTVASLVACSPGSDSGPAEGPCRFISAQELNKLTGLSAGEPHMRGSDQCGFRFAEVPTLQVTVIRLDGGYGPMCPSCTEVVEGLGRQAAWSDLSEQLDAFGGPGLDSKDLAIRIFKIVQPRTSAGP